MKKYRIAPKVKEQVLGRIKNDGISVADAAKDHGISTKTIYKWLGGSADGPSS
jgi:transposase-like protein